MKIAIVGSQNYPHKDEVVRYVYSLPKDTIVVSGGAKGVDTWAEETARERGMPEPIVFKAKWTKYGRSAGPIRNTKVVLAADRVVAFTTGSKGTRNTISQARKYGKEVEIHKAKVGDKEPVAEQMRLL